MKNKEVTAESLIQEVAKHMGVSYEEAMAKMEEFSIELEKLKSKKDE